MNILSYLPEISYLILSLLVLDLLGSGLFRLIVRPRAKRYWEAAEEPLLPQKLAQNQFPPQWLQYLEKSGATKAEPSGKVRLRMKGVVRTKPSGKWHPSECKAFFTSKPLTMVWYADITRAFLVSIKATEQFAQGQGFSTRWILSTFPYRWKSVGLPQSMAQRNAFYNLAAAVWQPQWWWFYALDWRETADDLLPFTCTIDDQVFFLKAQFNPAHQLTELSHWQENWQEINTKLVFSDYQMVQEQSIPLQVEVLEKDANGLLFVHIDLQVTDVVQKGPYAWW
ncbi:DUF6920 family protein [Haliscomenobacter hydrossis]|uniref:Uncharacterized protein n=1 Tax=Haliscomenobacter hydrossis (strain ATCC 27775 / DSM 1100 / LMG 10767 / O) TaxID=760192 RepID=F4KQG4_HALH1|nr:DUF6544 family protein [Haliscomenobacter hydrossis]AEE49953.1 hypothetical protein Halhy_2068 [Haliscomenobacter hydrossis DSM 1100]